MRPNLIPTVAFCVMILAAAFVIFAVGVFIGIALD